MDPIVLIGVGLGLLLFLLLVVLVVRRRGKRKQSVQVKPVAAPPVERAAPTQFQDAPSLTALIGQAKTPNPAGKTTGSRPGEPQFKAPATSEPTPKTASVLTPKRLVQPGHHDNKIQILVVDDNRDTCENVSRLIAFESDMEVVGQAYNGIMGVELAQEYQPHIVLMDINMPDMDGIEATREMGVKVPYSQIVIMSVQFETEYMRSAMLAGARDYQTKPFSADDLVNCLRRVYNSAQEHYRKYDTPQQSARSSTEVAVVERSSAALNVPLYLVYGPRGGAGTSTIAVNLAAALDQIQHGVTLIDTDLQFGDLPVQLNMRPTKSMANLTTSNRPDVETLPELLLTHSSGINVLFAPPRPETAELITGSMLTQVTRRLRDRSSAVVLDTCSYLTDHNLALIDMVNLVVLVITPDLASVKNARIFCDMAPHLGLTSERIVLVINRANMLGGIPAVQLEKALGLPRVFQIPDDSKLRYASVKGATIFQLDAATPAAPAIDTLARSLWELFNAPAGAEAATGGKDKPAARRA